MPDLRAVLSLRWRRETTQYVDRAYRTVKDRQDRPKGTSLGRAIAQQIVQLHGSSIEVESIVGAGTTFRFNLRTGDAP